MLKWSVLIAVGSIGGLVVACSSSTDSTGSASGATSTIEAGASSDSAASCATGSTMCGAACVDTKSDPANCGACGTACGAGTVCTKGACAASCPSGQSVCTAAGASTCASLDTDRENCGACGNACPAGDLCSAGTCGLSCGATYTMCSGKPAAADAGADAGDAGDGGDAARDASADAGAATPYCANLQTSEDDCGSCGTSCGYNEKCDKGLCCAQGTQACGGACIDVTSDPNNCGACGKVCGAATPYCGASTCINLVTFVGPQENVPVASLSGWTQCYKDLYSHGGATLANDVATACTKANILVACRQTDSPTLTLFAHAPRADVFFKTGDSNNTTHSANGTAWYYSTNFSMGFVKDGDTVQRSQADVETDVDSNLRLSWHTLSFDAGGYRCGSTLGLNSSSDWERLVFQAD